MDTDIDFLAISSSLAVEMWKLARAFEKSIGDLPEDKAGRRMPQLRYSRDRLETILHQAGLRLVVFDGEPFTANLPVSPINADEFSSDDECLIESTLEPSIITSDRVIHTGKVLLARNV
jgi:hypothetical protein